MTPIANSPRALDVYQYQVVNASILGTTREEALSEVMDRAERGEGGYACFVNAHVSVMTRQRTDVEAAVNGATFAFPDGMPVYLVGKYLFGHKIEKVSGPDFMGMMFSDQRGRKLRHFFYGGSQEVLDTLVAELNSRYPGSNIVGAISPPFRDLSEEEKAANLNAFMDTRAQIIWVGLGAPKQELWMADKTAALPDKMLMGVGAAFDFHAGTIERAPQWAQRLGLEWLHRLVQEPRRLFRRYVETNSLFLLYMAKDQARRMARWIR